MRWFLTKNTLTRFANVSGRVSFSPSSTYRYVSAVITAEPHPFHPPRARHASSLVDGRKNPNFDESDVGYGRTLQQVNLSGSFIDSEPESENDATMNEFLSRFVWIMRKKILEDYPECDRATVPGMLVVIVEKVVSEMEKGGLEKMEAAASMPSDDLSDDLWRTVWDVSSVVLQDMEREKKKEKMKSFLQSEEVKEMYRFAGEVGIRGDMLRELRFKWAREKMEESEFYQSLERLRKEESEAESQEANELRHIDDQEKGNDSNAGEGGKKAASLPKRHGKIKYKIYGLDLSTQKWAEVADKIHESGKVMWPNEPKPISGKCKLVTDQILGIHEEDDPAPLLKEWIDLLQPSRVDWINILDRLKDKNPSLYFKIAEYALAVDSFQANIRDYSKLIDALAKGNRLADAERILKKMNENGISPDVITSAVLVHMYCKLSSLDRAKEAFNSLKDHGFQPDEKLCSSMIMAYINGGQPKAGEFLLNEMETRDLRPAKEIYMALLESFAQAGDAVGADRMSYNIRSSFGINPDLETCTLLIEASGRAGDPDRARDTFNRLKIYGHKPDDRCTASMIAAYFRKNQLDKALDLLLELEGQGFEPGVATCTVLIEWFSKLCLFEEVEHILNKISQQGEAPPLKIHISLCEMYVEAGDERKALQALGVLESKIDQLGAEDFERIIRFLSDGGFEQDAHRLYELMGARGHTPSEGLKIAVLASKSVGTSGKKKKSLLAKQKWP